MAHHNPEDSAGAQLALVVAVKLLLSQFRGNEQALVALESELEAMRALLLCSPAEDRKLKAFEETAKSLLAVLSNVTQGVSPGV